MTSSIRVSSKTQNPGNPASRRRDRGSLTCLAAGPQVERPFFIWLHLYDPHSPYDPPEPFRAKYAGHLYDGEIAYADSQLGRVFDYLRRAGFYDQTLVVLLSDHGESWENMVKTNMDSSSTARPCACRSSSGCHATRRSRARRAW